MNRDNSSLKWRLEGDYFEGCNCKTVCPCTIMFNPNEGECKAPIAWHIEKGYFDNNNTLNLDDLNAGCYLYAPSNMFTRPAKDEDGFVSRRES